MVFAQLTSMIKLIYPFGTETGIFRYKKVNGIVDDALAPCVTNASAAVVLIIKIWSLYFTEKDFNYLHHLCDEIG